MRSKIEVKEMKSKMRAVQKHHALIIPGSQAISTDVFSWCVAVYILWHPPVYPCNTLIQDAWNENKAKVKNGGKFLKE